MKPWEDEAKLLLDFWAKYGPDLDQGGFIGKMDAQGAVHRDAPKGLVLNARILWTFSLAYRWFGEEAYLRLADRAYGYLQDHFYDAVQGGAYWSVNADGRPLQAHKQTYGLSFYLYGLVEYYRAAQREDARIAAVDLFYCIEEKALDPVYGGYLEAFSRSWTWQKDRLISGGADKSANTHLHLLEAYTALYGVWPHPDVKAALEKLKLIFEEKMYVPGRGMHAFFERQWAPVEAPLSYGHDIETYWLLEEAGSALGQGTARLWSEEMPRRALEQIDEQGGMWNDALRKQKHWWVQAEAMVGFAFAYRKTADPAYLEAIQNVWEFIRLRIKCAEGEWYWGVDENGLVLEEEDKMGFWKCPYHHVRALLILSKMGVEITETGINSA